MAKVLKISPLDNVGVALGSISQGEELIIEGGHVSAKLFSISEVPEGHKIALQTINKGGSIIKMGIDIGLASVQIETGVHVHHHNLSSRFI
ncbi:UxaA family hydrolase [Teredinibacter sp. KSP-S5-2]|uniref:UxaA family hydrolase n=1 Tax=Teredinibacter sp. KSP-S5-2 TaxID=3034506 RepID=UPI002934AE77|nr:UxaA family hydrolase [Teredinibacter sp. KSP-S5-2]WNO07862.1 UxaA family hydrolase [Teredinibacter sp. KSP-S5-2]